MANYFNEDQDRRKNTIMADSPEMTINFLRARLWSERSVSRTAKQRADELAKRVVELEEQLKNVYLQRKKAEKATADVLAILENHGISDDSEAYDSSSDQEGTLCESKAGNNSVEEDDASANVKVRRNDAEPFSGSELESSSLIGRSLSWKSSKNSHSLEKKRCMDSSRRRRSSFTSTGSSSSQRVGKSCRQIRRRETRLAVEDFGIHTNILDHQGNEVATCSECFPSCPDNGPETLREGSVNLRAKDLLEDPVSGVLENQRITDGNYFNEDGGNKDMEKALEHQAQLIGQYESEEKAQREWEEKYRENNSCTPDSCDPGNHSDVTEERDEIKAPPPPSTTGTTEVKSGLVDPCFSKESKTPNGFQQPLHIDMGCLQDQKCGTMVACESPAQEFAFSIAKGKHDQEGSENHHYHPPLHSSHHCADSHGTPGTHSAQVSACVGSSSLCKGEASGSTNELALLPHETSNKLGSVLEALQQAKLSLKQNLNRLPLVEGGSSGIKAIQPSVSALRTGDRLEMPVEYAGLFRVPTDFQFDATTQATVPGSDSRLSLANYSPEPAGDKLFSSAYMESNSSTFPRDRFLTVPSFPYSEIRSGVPTPTPALDPCLDAGLPYSSRYTYNTYLDPRSGTILPSSGKYTYPTQSFNPHLVPRMPSENGLSRSLSSREVGMPPSTHFSFYDHTRPNIYR